MSEGRALAGAGVAHLALLAALSLGWSAMQKPVLPPDSVAVDLLEIADTPRASAEARAATAPPTPLPAADAAVSPPVRGKVESASAPPSPRRGEGQREAQGEGKPAPGDVPTPIADTPAPPPKPKPTPKPQPKIKPAPNPDQLAQSLDQSLTAAPPRPKAKPRPQADPNQLASLLDKALTQAPARAHARPGPVQSAQPANAEAAARAAATLAQSIAGQIYPCWNVPPGSEGQTVDLHIRLAKDGTVAGAIEVRGQSGAPNPAIARVFADSAKRAVMRCAPLKLPAALYDQWRDIDPLHFDPKDVS